MRAIIFIQVQINVQYFPRLYNLTINATPSNLNLHSLNSRLFPFVPGVLDFIDVEFHAVHSFIILFYRGINQDKNLLSLEI